MSESYAIMPLSSEVRDWLAHEGLKDLPSADGRLPTLDELTAAVNLVAALESPLVSVSTGMSVGVTSSDGLTTSIIVAPSAASGHHEIHFRGGHEDLVHRIAVALARATGPLVVYAQSGSSPPVVHHG
jgi:hypothetical protein